MKNEKEMWFLLYSKNQKTLHIDNLQGMIDSNLEQIFLQKVHADFVVLAVFDDYTAANAACPEWRKHLGLDNAQIEAN